MVKELKQLVIGITREGDIVVKSARGRIYPVKKSSDLKTQVANMFTTAYTRKPNNGKMKNAGWYSEFVKWRESSKENQPNEKSVTEVITEDAIKKSKEVVKEAKNEAVKETKIETTLCLAFLVASTKT